jgi:imidazolonepropionase
VLGLGDVGRLAPWYRVDVLVLNVPDWCHLGGDRFAGRIKSRRLL